MPRVLVKHVGLDAAGGDAVDGDALGAAVDGKGTAETLDGGLGAGVQGVVGDARHDGGNGRRQDDAAAAAAVLETLLGDKELAPSVEVEDLVEQLLRHLELVAPDLHAAVGHDKVEPAKVRHGLVEEGDHLGRLADVGLDGDSLGTELLELRDDLLGGLAAATVVDNDRGAATAQLDGDTTSDATAGTRDQGNLASEGLGGVTGTRAGDVCGGSHVCFCGENLCENKWERGKGERRTSWRGNAQRKCAYLCGEKVKKKSC